MNLTPLPYKGRGWGLGLYWTAVISGVYAPISALSRLEAHPSCCYGHQQIEWALQRVPLVRRCRGQPIGLKRSHRQSLQRAHDQMSTRRSACKRDDVQSLD